MKRVLLIAVGSIIGLLLSGGFIWIYNTVWGLPEGDTFATQGFILQACILFFMGIYNTGKIGYAILGDAQEAQEIGAFSKGHLLLLNGLGVALFLLGFVFDG